MVVVVVLEEEEDVVMVVMVVVVVSIHFISMLPFFGIVCVGSIYILRLSCIYKKKMKERVRRKEVEVG